MKSEPRRSGTRTAIGLVCFLTALVLLVVTARPAAKFSAERHWQVFGTYAVCAALLMAAAWKLAVRRYRIAVSVASVLAIGVAALAHPVCVPITEAERPSFESVLPLEERAARGEPFCKLDGCWHQCKSVLSRAFFF